MIDFLLRTLLALTLGGGATVLGYCLRALHVQRLEQSYEHSVTELVPHVSNPQSQNRDAPATDPPIPQAHTGYDSAPTPRTTVKEVIKKVADPQQSRRIEQLRGDRAGLIDGLIRGYDLATDDEERDHILGILEAGDIHPIDPATGDPLDPSRHDVVVRIPTNNRAENDLVARPRRVGWYDNRAENLLRPAEVAVWSTDRTIPYFRPEAIG
ncbi:hypothetical protein ACTD5D_21215 [Nocardia takedensis]|uniref:hypothetical protein n=1 Tax=Nocardia takedensis TaxID=259390 RepID=UPI003F769374